MNPTVTIQELLITIAAKKQNPTLLTPDFLKGSGIVPSDWKLTRTPVLNSQIATVSFANGVNFLGQPGTITLSEPIGEDKEKMKIPELVKKYAIILPNLDYQAVGINPRSFATFPEAETDAARQFIAKLFATAPWQNAGTAPVRASLNLAYTFDNHQMNLTLTEAKLQPQDKPSQAAVVFSGNFPYELNDNVNGGSKHNLEELIGNWQRDLETFSDIVNQFLREDDVVTPSLKE